ncbi:LuxR C-terminal-related transcriptional regulator [Nocardia uniformis]|nr:LuxR C-terminal-related transcriptional regulator [Nocardia uniformis]
MVGNTPVALDSLPGAREIFRELDSEDPTPLLYLIRGRSGTGKSTLLSAIRSRLRARGIALSDNPADSAGATNGFPAVAGQTVGGFPAVQGYQAGRQPGRPGGPRVALVVDDAHTLSDIALKNLCAAAESGTHTVVIASCPRPHDQRLRTLTDLVARRGRVVDLRALALAEIAPFARELGMMVPRGLTQHIHRQTDGIHGGVVAALTAACATRLDAGVGAVDTAVTTWARARLDDADPDLLDTLVVAAIGAGLDAAELIEVLDVTAPTAQDLVDRARASALITDADLLVAPAVAPLRTLVGDRRFLAVQRRLLRARLDAGLLRDHTALLLAESGVRDPRLAEFLCTAAEKAGDEAVRYYAAAATAGADPTTIAVRWADAAARTGDCDTALRQAEPALARDDIAPAELAAAVRICAGVWTRRGLISRAAQLYTWLGAHRVGPDWAVGAAVLYLAGDATAAHALSASADRWPPTEATARAGLIATALAKSVGPGSPAPRPDSSPAFTGVDTRGSAPNSPTTTGKRSDWTDAAAVSEALGPDSAAPDQRVSRPSIGIGFSTANSPAMSKLDPPSEPIPSGTPETAVAAIGFPRIRTDTAHSAAAALTGETGGRTTRPRSGFDSTTERSADGSPNSTAYGTPAASGAAGIATAAMGFPKCPTDERRGAALIAASELIHAAHSSLTQSDAGGDRFLPCSAVSIAALLSLSMGEPRRAADALRGGAAADPQLRVLAAWVAMLGGDERAAAAVVAQLDPTALDPRDRLLAHAVIVGLARRGGDHTALTLAWQAAIPLFDEVGADLLTLLPIGELWLAGIRLRDEARVTALVDAARQLLRRLGDPPAWANSFHWYAIQAAIAHESPEELLPHAHRLKTAAQAGDPQAAALADAGRTWVLVLRGQVERAPVEAAVRRLAGLGLSWDAARLASEAALAADDSATATALLKLARTVRVQSRPSDHPVRPLPATPAPRPEPLPDAVLSEREREVAELVLLGLTYREIGARLYISAKTVEHHVARIRRRIGAGSRSELLSMLRAMGHGSLLV